MDTEQERFWAGEFGDAYTGRNEQGVASNIALFARALRVTQSISTVFEIGTNRGLNLDALTALLPSTELHGIEINAKAAEKARERHPKIRTGSVIDPGDLGGPYELVFTKGVLIHIAPEKLPSGRLSGGLLHRRSHRPAHSVPSLCGHSSTASSRSEWLPSAS